MHETRLLALAIAAFLLAPLSAQEPEGEPDETPEKAAAEGEPSEGEAEPRQDPEDPEDPAGESEDAVEEEEEPEPPPPRKRAEGTLPIEWSEQLPWRSIGPANMGGRVTDFAVHPEDPSVWWVGTAAGGLLKTSNNGFSFEYQFHDQTSCSIGAVAVAPSDGDVVWVGTGEVNPRNSVSWGDGVYKSTDGGETWWHMGLERSFQISIVLVHPEDPQVVWVGAVGRLWGPNEERGLYKTTDGGETWEQVLFVDERTGVIDARLKPDDPDTLLVATYERERDIYCSNDPAKKWGPGSGIHRSTDGGATWTEVTEGLPTCDKGRIGLDWYVADPSIVYAIVESERITQEPEDAAYLGVRGEDAEVGARLTDVTEESPAAEAGLAEDDIVLRVGDETVVTYDALVEQIKAHRAGDEVELEVVREKELQVLQATFGNRPPPEGDPTDVHGRPRPGPHHIGLGGQRQNVQDDQGDDGHEYGGIYRSGDAGVTWTRINSLNPRPMYYSEIRVDPSDDQLVYVLGTSLYKSNDGGATFTSDGHDSSVHVDHHALWIDPRDGRHILLGNDGGIYVTWDRMARWDHHNHVAIGQFYNVTCDTQRDYRVYGGLQDNGSWGGPSVVRNDDGPTNQDWFRIGGGDGFVCRVDAEDPDQLYYESQNGGMGRRHLRTGEGGFVRPRGERDVEYRFNWNTPFLLSAHNSRIHYSAGNYVFRSLDRGNSARRISPEIATTDRGSATALAESPKDSDLLFVGTDDGALWTTRDGGHEWIDLFALNEGLVGPEGLASTEPRAQSVAYTDPAPERAEEAVEPRPDDPVTGTWRCRAMGEGIDDPDQGRFTLELTLEEDDKVTGWLSSDIGDGDIAGGRWKAEKRELRFRFEGESLTLEFEGTIDERHALTGKIEAAGGAFRFDFEGEREVPEEEEPEEAEALVEPRVAVETETAAEAEAGEPAPEEEPEEGADEEQDDEEAEPEEPEPRKFLKDTIDQLLPGRRYVSSITPSRHDDERVYVTFDGHRSDDDEPWIFVSKDRGETWRSLRGNLPANAGSVRDLEEDPENDDLLFLGTEFRAYVSIDRGESWTELGQGLPTVPVHDFAINEASNELVAGTHGRSIWVLDVTPLREMDERALDEDVQLYPVRDAVRWRREPSRGETTRRFVGANPPAGTRIYYSLDRKAKDVSLEVHDAAGEVLRELEATGEKGLHAVDWDLRRGREDTDREGRSRFRRGRSVGEGTYTVVLKVGEETYTTPVRVMGDPSHPADPWTEFDEYGEEWFDVEEAEPEEWDD